MIEYEEEIEEKDNIIDEYKKKIGNDQINEEVIKRGKEKSEFDPNKIKYKNKIVSRLIQKAQSTIQQ